MFSFIKVGDMLSPCAMASRGRKIGFILWWPLKGMGSLEAVRPDIYSVSLSLTTLKKATAAQIGNPHPPGKIRYV
jgi:hypothetical protein